MNCPQATCTVDASGSTDTAPGTIASYAWNFGDGGDRHRRDDDPHLHHQRREDDHADRHGQPGAGVSTDDPHGQRDRRWRRRRQPAVPGHTHLVPDKPRNNTPRISNGEIWDIEVVPQPEPGLHRRQLHLDRRTPSPRRRRSTRPTWRQLQPQHRPDRHQLPPDLQRRRGRRRGHARTAPSCSSAARSTPSTAWRSRRSPAST